MGLYFIDAPNENLASELEPELYARALDAYKSGRIKRLRQVSQLAVHWVLENPDFPFELMLAGDLTTITCESERERVRVNCACADRDVVITESLYRRSLKLVLEVGRADMKVRLFWDLFGGTWRVRLLEELRAYTSSDPMLR